MLSATTFSTAGSLPHGGVFMRERGVPFIERLYFSKDNIDKVAAMIKKRGVLPPSAMDIRIFLQETFAMQNWAFNSRNVPGVSQTEGEVKDMIKRMNLTTVEEILPQLKALAKQRAIYAKDKQNWFLPSALEVGTFPKAQYAIHYEVAPRANHHDVRWTGQQTFP